MSGYLSNRSDPVIIVGAGIFGLSTAIHLAQRGYRNVTIFDKQPYHETHYNYFKGCDAASADINKIFRCAYGAQKEYMHLSLESREAWQQWNEELASGKCVPDGMTTSDRLYINNGNLSLTDEKELPPFEYLTVRNMDEAGFPGTQLITEDTKDSDVAKQTGFEFAMDPFQRRSRGQRFLGVLDTTGGTLVADKACRFALHKAKSLGVRTVFGKEAGKFTDFVRSRMGEVTGIRTADGVSHQAAKVVLACGGWTPSLVPSLDSVCETTSGSVIIIRIPKSSPLFEKYSPKNFPTWTWNVRAGPAGGLYGFAVNDEGLLKIGYRGEKYTNSKVQFDGKERSVPLTRYTEDSQITGIPQKSWLVIKRFIHEWMPDLLDPKEGVKIEMSRLCWYCDSWDNHFVVDNPEGESNRNVLVATAGSGHAFKYTPILGRYIADVLEGKGLERDLIRSWRWRKQPNDDLATVNPGAVINQLNEGASGTRSLEKQEWAHEHNLSLQERPRL